MKHVNKNHLPRLANLNELIAANRDICQLDDDDERSKYIRLHAHKCSEIRNALWTLGCGKCWYSEARLQQQQGHVEHFRPKKQVATEDHCGYWWRAFDWSNLRLAHPTVNTRVTDYLTGQKAGKGTYFPLRNPAMRAINKTSEINEEPILLDPTIPEDCRLICFDTSSGKPIPRYNEAEDVWRNQRARESIEYYHLDEGTWNYQRKDLVDEVSIVCDRIIGAERTDPKDETQYEKLLAELLSFLEPFSEFTAVASQVIREKGLIEKVFPVPGVG